MTEGWEDYEEALRLALAGGPPLEDYVRGALGERSTTHFDHALSFLDPEQFERVVATAVERLEPRDDGSGAASVVAYASLQLPELLEKHLPRLWKLEPNADTYYAEWPWRAARPAECERLLADGSERARTAALQTRDAAVIARLGDVDDEELALVGFDAELRRLAPATCFHLVLPPSVVPDRVGGSPTLRLEHHPTWGLEPVATVRFGGLADGRCALCEGRLHRLAELDPVPPGLGVSARRLELATCLSCLGWSEDVLFQTHGADGAAVAAPWEGERVEPEFPAEPLLEAEVGIAPTPARWRFQDWALANDRENLNRLGGEPTWIQDAGFPDCLGCGTAMSALLQLDSDLATADGGGWMWGSGGIGYVFWCDACAISAALWQCT